MSRTTTNKMRYILLNKPYEVLTQFTDEHGRATLKDFVPVPDVYPVGRLDFDSEGLLLLTDDKQLQHRLSDPRYKVPKTYWAQVEGLPSEEALDRLRQGVQIKEGFTLPAEVQALPDEDTSSLWERTPPIRYRQVRKMCAAVGLPCLRLVRQALGELTLSELQPGQWRDLTADEVLALRGLAGAGSRNAQPFRRPTHPSPAARRPVRRPRP
jgi:23S rRNA pseudouridine2457 synthase